MSDSTKNLAAALEPPAMISNRFYSMAGARGFRLSFGERGRDGVTRFHSAVFVTVEDIPALINLLTSQLGTVKASLAAGTADVGQGSQH